MEVKIKNNNELIDAVIDMVDGVMVVSPKEMKFEPKDGDVVFSGFSLISIFKKKTTNASFSAYAAFDGDAIQINFNHWTTTNLRPATEEEKKKLFDKLKEEGWEWKADTKELVKLKWKPKVDETFYYPFHRGAGVFITGDYTYTKQSSLDKDTEVMNGWCFKTKEECQAFCDKLNEAINQVKP